MKMNVFTCPKCGAALIRRAGAYQCDAGHSYDRAKSGYVNLLPPGKAVRGDDKRMVRARRDFLRAGHYLPLAKEIASICAQLLPQGGRILDCGCGEGYYDGVVYAQTGAEIAGVDIAKDAVEMAAKWVKAGEFAVASVFHLPVAAGAFDGILNLFAPMVPQAYARALKEGGWVLKATPLPMHLGEMKAILYDAVRPTEPECEAWEGFAIEARREVVFKMQLQNQALMALFEMTPYCYTTPQEGMLRLGQTEQAEITAAFSLVLYRKERG